MSRNNENMDTSTFLWVVLLLTAIFGIPAVYAAKAGMINGALIALAKVQLKSFVPFSEEAQKAWDHITSLDSAALTWEQMQAILSYTGKWIRWPFAMLLAVLGVASIIISPIWGLTRRFNMTRLLKNNAESFPCLRPVVGRGKYLLSPQSYDSGPWRFARTPAQFALEHGLLLDAKGTVFLPEQALHKGMASMDLPAYGNAFFDEKKALVVVQEQLGNPFRGFDNLDETRKALACAFIAYGFGNKEECLNILDTVSSSYTERKSPACEVLGNTDFQDRLTKLRDQNIGILLEPLLVRHSAFELPWFMALLHRARKKGVLSSAQFLWLRPMDRPLWYALSQCGGRVTWAEGFAAWSHYAAEEKAKRSLSKPHVLPAVTSLRASLVSQGWLADTPRALPVQQEQPQAKTDPALPDSQSEIEPVPDFVYAAAEEEPDVYDANIDPNLPKEQV